MRYRGLTDRIIPWCSGLTRPVAQVLVQRQFSDWERMNSFVEQQIFFAMVVLAVVEITIDRKNRSLAKPYDMVRCRGYFEVEAFVVAEFTCILNTNIKWALGAVTKPLRTHQRNGAEWDTAGLNAPHLW